MVEVKGEYSNVDPASMSNIQQTDSEVIKAKTIDSTVPEIYAEAITENVFPMQYQDCSSLMPVQCQDYSLLMLLIKADRNHLLKNNVQKKTLRNLKKRLREKTRVRNDGNPLSEGDC